MSIDKSIRADYAIQGGGPNYLGKQKMVKAPKKWQSSPHHDPAELAYITEKEKDILIALDVHGSLKDGKPNRGPSGIISLQGDMGGYGGTGGGGGGGGGNGAYQDRIQQIAAAQARAAAASRAAEQQAAAQRDMQATIAQAERAEANRVAQQAAEGKVDVGFQEALKKTADARQRQEEFKDTGDIDALTDLTGFDTAPKVDIRDIQGEVTDPDSVSYDPLLKALDEPKVDEGFKRYIRQVQQPIAPTPKSGMGTTLKNIALGVLAPQLLAGTALAKPYNLYRQYQTAKRLIPKGVQDTIRTAFTPRVTTETKRKTKPLVARDRDNERVRSVAETITTGTGLESGEKLLGVDSLRQKEEARRRGRIIMDILNKNSYQGKDLTQEQRKNLMDYIEQINRFLVPVTKAI